MFCGMGGGGSQIIYIIYTIIFQINTSKELQRCFVLLANWWNKFNKSLTLGAAIFSLAIRKQQNNSDDICFSPHTYLLDGDLSYRRFSRTTASRPSKCCAYKKKFGYEIHIKLSCFTTYCKLLIFINTWRIFLF